jgi:hypothetical protein
VDPSQNHVSNPLLVFELEILVPFGAIYDVPAHLIFAPALEKLVFLD